MTTELEQVSLGPFGLRIERLVYSTVVLMSVLVLYDGWTDLTFAGTAVVIIAPTIALAIAHLFAEGVQEHYRTRHPLSWPEWRHIARDQWHDLLAAVPPLVILCLGAVSPLDPRSTIAVLLWTGVVTLVVLALIAGHRAGIRGWRLVVAGMAGGVVGLIVIALQVVLKPH